MRVGWLKNGVWQAKTSIGGAWNWDDNVSGLGFNAGISITNYTCPAAQLLEIDDLIDTRHDEIFVTEETLARWIVAHHEHVWLTTVKKRQ